MEEIKINLELTDSEQKESLIYVCYERTTYHLFKRNNKLDNYIWLFIDRILGFRYTTDNEPLIPKYNALLELQNKFEETYFIDFANLKETLIQRLKNGYQAHSMMKNYREDGSFYNTSSLIEGVLGDNFFLTKTNEQSLKTCIPHSYEEISNKFHKTKENKVEISFIKIPTEFINYLNSFKENEKLFIILKEVYGYNSDGLKIYNRKKEEIKIERGEFQKLHRYFYEKIENLAIGKIEKSDQLRMYKHIANKIEPSIFCWENIFENEECGKSFINENEFIYVTEIMNKIRMELKNIYKWFSLLNSRPSKKFAQNYVDSLGELEKNYYNYQVFLYDILIRILVR